MENKMLSKDELARNAPPSAAEDTQFSLSATQHGDPEPNKGTEGRPDHSGSALWSRPEPIKLAQFLSSRSRLKF